MQHDLVLDIYRGIVKRLKSGLILSPIRNAYNSDVLVILPRKYDFVKLFWL